MFRMHFWHRFLILPICYVMMIYEWHGVDVSWRRLYKELNGSKPCSNKALLVHYHTAVLSELSLLSAEMNKLLFRRLPKPSFRPLLSEESQVFLYVELLYYKPLDYFL